MQKFTALPFFALAGSILITLLIWGIYIIYLEDSHFSQFESESKELTDKIEHRMSTYEGVLVGVSGLFAASETITMDEWETYVSSQNLEKRFPGIQGTGYIKYVQNQHELEDLIELMQQYGLDNYTIKPVEEKSEYFPVKFLYPLDFRNERALGFDVSSEPIRYQAIKHAINSNEITITGKIILVQETDVDIQNGFLMLLPIYSDENKETLDGIAYTVFRMNDLMNGIFNTEVFQETSMKLYDDSEDIDSLLFDSQKIFPINDNLEFQHKQVSSVGNRDWIFVLECPKPAYTNIELTFLILIPVTGFGMSALLFFTLFYLNRNLILTQNTLKTSRFSAIGELSARLAHDLRNPLSVMKLSMELLKNNSDSKVSDPEVVKRINLVEKSIDRISHQVDDVLEYVRDTPLHTSKFNISQTIQNIIQGMVIPEGIKINTTSDLIYVIADERKIEVVLSNLILNSIQAIKENGEINIQLLDNDNEIVIRITDSGTGMSDEDVDKIFEPLFTTKQKGTGLGLVSCKNIINQHNGDISVKTNPTTFTITLPKKEIQ